MDSSFTVKSRDGIHRTVIGRSNSVRTELSPSHSVNAAQQSAHSHRASDMMARDPSMDPQCHTVLDRDREERERRRRARKDEALLRQKAYGRSVVADTLHPDTSSHADIEV